MKLTKNTKEKKVPMVPIVSDALILQRDLADGRSIPLIIIDTTNYPEIARAIDLHSETAQGEVALTWGKSSDSKFIVLDIESISPVEIKYTIVFNVTKHHSLLNIILKTHLLYIQAGTPGDRLGNNLNAPKLLIELPISSFESEIMRLIEKAKIQRFKKLKVKRKDLKKVIEEFDSNWNAFLSERFK